MEKKLHKEGKNFSVGKLNINLTNKWFYTFVLLIGLVAVGGVLVFGQSNPAVFGHTSSEISGNFSVDRISGNFPANRISQGSFVSGNYVFPSTSKVGIGVNNPEVRLDVAGTIQTNSLIAKGGGIMTLDDNDNPRLWGQGRPGVDVYDSIDGNINICEVRDLLVGRGNMPVSWDNAAAGCPIGWWVCTRDERGASSCGGGDRWTVNCSGQTLLGSRAWVSNAADVTITPNSGRAIAFGGGSTTGSMCTSLPVWCCTEKPIDWSIITDPIINCIYNIETRRFECW